MRLGKSHGWLECVGMWWGSQWIYILLLANGIQGKLHIPIGRNENINTAHYYTQLINFQKSNWHWKNCKQKECILRWCGGTPSTIHWTRYYKLSHYSQSTKTHRSHSNAFHCSYTFQFSKAVQKPNLRLCSLLEPFTVKLLIFVNTNKGKEKNIFNIPHQKKNFSFKYIFTLGVELW